MRQDVNINADAAVLKEIRMLSSEIQKATYQWGLMNRIRVLEIAKDSGVIDKDRLGDEVSRLWADTFRTE